MTLVIGGLFPAPVPTDGGKGKKHSDGQTHPEIKKRWAIFAIIALVAAAAMFGPALIAGINTSNGIDTIDTGDIKSPDPNPANTAGNKEKEANIKTVKVPFGISGLDAVAVAKPGIFYEYTYDESQAYAKQGFIILEKDKLKDATFMFSESKVQIIKIGGIYKIKSDDKPALDTSWCVIYKLPFVSNGKPIYENAKYIEFRFSDDDLNSGKYAYLVLTK